MCYLEMEMTKKMDAPIHVFYEVDHFFQNHRSYVKSLSWDQLHPMGGDDEPTEDDLEADCHPLWKNDSKLLNPCGAVPNTLFNDVITLENGDVAMKEDGIAWRSDVKELYKMPPNFKRAPAPDGADDPCLGDGAAAASVACDPSLCAASGLPSPCFGYGCAGGAYDASTCAVGDQVLFTYGKHDTYTYLYETFPQVISPLVGPNAEHFAVWMKTAALPNFRKLYGRITSDLDKGTVLRFRIENNWDVRAFDGRKSLVVATGGFETEFVGFAYVVVGTGSLGFAILFALLQLLWPRKMGDVRDLAALLAPGAAAK